MCYSSGDFFGRAAVVKAESLPRDLYGLYVPDKTYPLLFAYGLRDLACWQVIGSLVINGRGFSAVRPVLQVAWHVLFDNKFKGARLTVHVVRYVLVAKYDVHKSTNTF